MTEFTVKLAGIPVGVCALYESTKRFCSDFLCTDTPVFSVAITESDIKYENNTSAKEYKDITFSVQYLETLAVYRKIAERMPDYGVFLMHGAAVALGGEAYLFTAPSGTGKTTHIRSWLRCFDSAFVINGDKPLVAVTENGVFVCGTPWQGKENYGINQSAELKAICILQRADKDSLIETDIISELPILLSQSYRPHSSDSFAKTVRLLEKVTKSVSVFRFGCTMNPESGKIAYESFKGKFTDE